MERLSHPYVQSTCWDRCVHSATLLGYGLLLVLCNIPFALYWSQQEWVVLDSRGVDVFNEHMYTLQCFFLCAWFLAMTANIALAKDLTPVGTRDGGLKYSAVSAGLAVIIVPITFAVFATTSPARYYGIDYILVSISTRI